MKEVKSQKANYASASELMTVVGVVGVLVVMIIPLPPFLLDFLLALNITLAITILLIAMYTLKPLDFFIFPSLLLVTTLFRLSLNVASTRLILSETPTNPYMRVLDLARLSALASRYQIRTAIDSTLATPINLRALPYGIDLVFHSATKYLGGHNDLLAGAVVGS